MKTYDERLETIMDRTSVRDTILATLINDNAPATFVQGDSGSGKTSFITNLLARNAYNSIYYDVCNYQKTILDDIDNNLSGYNDVINMFKKKRPRNVIVIDGVEAMNCIDRSSINHIIQMIRKRKTNHLSMNNIIFISSNNADKGITDLTKLCSVIKLHRPTDVEQHDIIDLYTNSSVVRDDIAAVAKNDMRKIYMYIDLMISAIVEKPVNPCFLCMNVHGIIDAIRSDGNSCHKILNITNETNRTIISLIWYENLVDFIKCESDDEYIAAYLACLNHICTGDYIDRVIFQKQVWQLNEPSFCIKVIAVRNVIKDCLHPDLGEVRFTKVLTKYSNEYNNLQFIISLCDRLGLDRCDMMCFFTNSQNNDYKRYNITDVEYRRIMRFMMKKNSSRVQREAPVVSLDVATSVA